MIFRNCARAASVGLVLAVIASGCITRTVQNRIEVKGDASVDQKIASARSLVTQARLDRLKQQLRERFPSLTDAQLNTGLGIRWDVLTMKSFTGKGTTTAVFVSVLGQSSPGFDANAVVAAAVAILEPEVNPPSLPQSRSKAFEQP